MWRFLGTLFVIVLVIVPGAQAHAQSDAAVEQAIMYMRQQQAADGTFAGFGAGSTADAVIALAAANVKVDDVRNGSVSAVDGLRTLVPEAVKDVGVAAKFVIAALMAGQNPRGLGDTDLVAAVEQGLDQASGQYGKDVTTHALSLIALRAVGAQIRPEAVAALENLQRPDGGYNFDGTPATESDTNTTALVIQALSAVGSTADARTKAVDYLRSQQNDDGGFPYSQTSEFGNGSDANSTAASIQAILASGDTLENWAKSGATPRDRLLALQNTSGAFRFQDAQPADNQLATYQAIPALVSKTYPLEPILIALPSTSEQPTSGTPASSEGGPAPSAGTGVTLPVTGRELQVALPLAVGLVLILAGLILRRRTS